RTAKKFASILVANLAILTVVLNTGGNLPSAPTAEAQAGVISVPLGLTRKRGAFRKAISILTDGAGANKRLANYLDGLKKRIKGDTAIGDNTSGVAAVRHDSGIRVAAANSTCGKSIG